MPTRVVTGLCFDMFWCLFIFGLFFVLLLSVEFLNRRERFPTGSTVWVAAVWAVGGVPALLSPRAAHHPASRGTENCIPGRGGKGKKNKQVQAGLVIVGSIGRGGGNPRIESPRGGGLTFGCTPKRLGSSTPWVSFQRWRGIGPVRSGRGDLGACAPPPANRRPLLVLRSPGHASARCRPKRETRAVSKPPAVPAGAPENLPFFANRFMGAIRLETRGVCGGGWFYFFPAGAGGRGWGTVGTWPAPGTPGAPNPACAPEGGSFQTARAARAGGEGVIDRHGRTRLGGFEGLAARGWARSSFFGLGRIAVHVSLSVTGPPTRHVHVEPIPTPSRPT